MKSSGSRGHLGPRFPRARRPHSMSRSRPAAFGRIFSMISAQLVSWSDRSEGGAVVAHLKTAKLVSDRSEPIDEVGFALASTPELAFEGDQATPQPHPGLAAFPR